MVCNLMIHICRYKGMLASLCSLLVCLAAQAAEVVELDDLQYELDTEQSMAKVVSWMGNVDKIVIPSSISYNNATYAVTAISASAFQGKNIVQITIPASVTLIEEHAFMNCGRLSKFTLESGKDAVTLTGHLFGDGNKMELNVLS